MGRRAKKVYSSISAWPIAPRIKFGLVKYLRSVAFMLKREDGKQACLIMSNEGYGHEYWLRHYSGYKRAIYAEIEHGVYFGQNISPAVNVIPDEWEIGSFITFGTYRKECISKAYPECNVETIGPYIQYADTDFEYLRQIKSHLDLSEKTTVLFPAHSVATGRVLFSHEALIKECKKCAMTYGFKNLVVCLSPMDFNKALVALYEKHGFLVVTCGGNSKMFLPKQRAIFEAADLVVSNSLGTHVGYSMAMNVPYRFISPVSLEEQIKGNCIAPGVNFEALREERDIFFDMFSFDNAGLEPSAQQLELYNYFWGGDIQKSPEQLFAALKRCKAHYLDYRKGKQSIGRVCL